DRAGDGFEHARLGVRTLQAGVRRAGSALLFGGGGARMMTTRSKGSVRRHERRQRDGHGDQSRLSAKFSAKFQAGGNSGDGFAFAGRRKSFHHTTSQHIDPVSERINTS